MAETSSPGDITNLLNNWRSGDKHALDELIQLVYKDLKKIAEQKFKQYASCDTIQPTILVHEAYVRLLGQSDLNCQNRSHFYAIAAITIRRILIDHYRKKISSKRGGDKPTVTLSDIEIESTSHEIDLICLNDALEKLEKLDQTQARIVEMRFFADMTIHEIAETLKLSSSTIERELRAAKAWLFSRLSPL